MLYSEFLEVCAVDSREFSAMDYHTFIEPFYGESEDIPDVNGKAVFAQWFARQRKAFNRLRETMSAVGKAERDNHDRALEIGGRASALDDRERWIAKRENELREHIAKLRQFVGN